MEHKPRSCSRDNPLLGPTGEHGLSMVALQGLCRRQCYGQSVLQTTTLQRLTLLGSRPPPALFHYSGDCHNMCRNRFGLCMRVSASACIKCPPHTHHWCFCHTAFQTSRMHQRGSCDSTCRRSPNRTCRCQACACGLAPGCPNLRYPIALFQLNRCPPACARPPGGTKRCLPYALPSASPACGSQHSWTRGSYLQARSKVCRWRSKRPSKRG